MTTIISFVLIRPFSVSFATVRWRVAALTTQTEHNIWLLNFTLSLDAPYHCISDIDVSIATARNYELANSGASRKYPLHCRVKASLNITHPIRHHSPLLRKVTSWMPQLTVFVFNLCFSAFCFTHEHHLQSKAWVFILQLPISEYPFPYMLFLLLCIFPNNSPEICLLLEFLFSFFLKHRIKSFLHTLLKDT